jgi:uncharacterized protein DUF2721
MSTAQEVLQTMITPAVLISATGTLIMSTSNRTARVTERVRQLSERARTLPHADDIGAFLERQVTLLATRLVLLRSAMLALYLSMGAFVAASLLIGFSNLTPWLDGWPAVGAGLAGASVLLTACVQLVRESRLATKSSLEELEHLRRAHTR